MWCVVHKPVIVVGGRESLHEPPFSSRPPDHCVTAAWKHETSRIIIGASKTMGIETLKPVYNDRLGDGFSSFWSTSKWLNVTWKCARMKRIPIGTQNSVLFYPNRHIKCTGLTYLWKTKVVVIDRFYLSSNNEKALGWNSRCWPGGLYREVLTYRVKVDCV
jgi:hypothetical protein